MLERKKLQKKTYRGFWRWALDASDNGNTFFPTHIVASNTAWDAWDKKIDFKKIEYGGF